MINPTDCGAALDDRGLSANPAPAGSKYYTGEELADLWKVSPRMIERIFMNHPQVLKVDTIYLGKQRIGLRIPEYLARGIGRQA